MQTIEENTLLIHNYEPKHLVSFWDESEQYDEDKLNFSFHGYATTKIPEFHIRNYFASIESMDIKEFQYSKVRGNEVLLEAICKHLHHYYKSIKPENIFIAEGANRAINAILDEHLMKGDEIMMFEPFYTPHILDSPYDRVEKMRLCSLELNDLNEWTFKIEKFRKALNSSIKALIITNPHNPTGYIFSKKDLQQISDVLKDYPRIIVIEDNVYYSHIIDQKSEMTYFSAIEDNFNRTYNVFNAGKTVRALGLRIGWAISSKNMIDRVVEERYRNFGHVSSVEQYVVAKDLEDMNKPYFEFDNYYRYIEYDVRKRMDLLCEVLKRYKLNPIIPKGTFYLTADISKVRHMIPEKYFNHLGTKQKMAEADKAFCRWMIIEKGIGFLPYSCLSLNKSKYDTLIRITVNRTFDEIKKVEEAFIDLLINLESKT